MIHLDYLEHVVLSPPSNEQMIHCLLDTFLQAQERRMKQFQEPVFRAFFLNNFGVVTI